VTCPAGVTRPVARSGRVTFGAACHGCPLRDWCTTSADGRSLKLTEYDAALRAACAAWSSDPGLRQDYAQHRPHVERVIAQAATWRAPAQAPLPRGGQEPCLAQAPHRCAQPAEPGRQGPRSPKDAAGLVLHRPDRMLWMMRMVPLAMGLQTCGLHSDGLQSWPYCGRVSLSRPLALVSPSGSPATVVVRPCRMRTSPDSARALNMCRMVPGFSPWSWARSGTEGSASPGANSPVSIAARQQPGGRRRPGGRPRRSGCADCGRPAGR